MGDVELRPVRVFITDHLVQHDGRDYPTGSEFRESDATPEQIATLRKLGALKLPEEIESADRLNAEKLALQQRVHQLEAQLAEQMAAQSGEAPKSARALKVATAAADAAPAAAE